MATLLLGFYPASAAMWQAWLALHSSFGRFWLPVEAEFGHSIALQLAFVALAVAAVLTAAASRRWLTLSFVGNHAALIAVAVPPVAAGRATVSSLEVAAIGDWSWMVSLLSPMTGIHAALVAAGLASCVLCHVMFVASARRRHAPVALRMKELARNL